MRRVSRFAALLALALAAAGCSGNSITGGSVPTGTTRVAGEAALATDPNEPVVGAQVVVTDAEGTELEATTDGSGLFSFAIVAPGPAVIRASTPRTRPLELRFTVPEQGTAEVALALVPTDVEPGEVHSLTLDREGIVARVGETVRIRAMGASHPRPGSPSPPPDLTPSWVVEGGVGVIRHSGAHHALFVATRAGTGQIVVTLGDRQTSIRVTVLP